MDYCHLIKNTGLGDEALKVQCADLEKKNFRNVFTFYNNYIIAPLMSKNHIILSHIVFDCGTSARNAPSL